MVSMDKEHLPNNILSKRISVCCSALRLLKVKVSLGPNSCLVKQVAWDGPGFSNHDFVLMYKAITNLFLILSCPSLAISIEHNSHHHKTLNYINFGLVHHSKVIKVLKLIPFPSSILQTLEISSESYQYHEIKPNVFSTLTTVQSRFSDNLRFSDYYTKTFFQFTT